MTVVKRKRKESRFQVFHHLAYTRREVTDFLLRDFGYDPEKALNRLLRSAGVNDPENLTDDQRTRLNKFRARDIAFHQWFIRDERKKIVDCLRDITTEVYVANNFRPEFVEEAAERRLHQDKAIGLCFALVQELQYAVETLPVDVNKYLRFADMIDEEIRLLKSWRKSDRSRFNQKFRVASDSATNFANANNNGNANNSNASNSNGIRPDFAPTAAS